MLRRFFPRMYVDSVYDVPYAQLTQRRIRGLVFDIDNTLTPFDAPLPSPQAQELLDKLRADGFGVCLLSNNNESRVTAFNAGLGLPCVHGARKPSRKGLRQALALLGTTAEDTAIIGDQVFTDVWCGNRLGLYTVLVKPVAQRDEFTVWLKRGAERIVIGIYLKKVNRR